jgi:UDP-N-acetylglucosamine acyltransferase
VTRAAVHPSASVHPTALVEDGAEIAPGVEVGPFSIIGPAVRLAEGVVVKSHAVITGDTEIGAGSTIFPFATIGGIPQDMKFKGEHTKLVVGERCRVREGVTMNTGTAGGGGVTRVGDDCLFMTGSHVGHDAQVGNRVIMANQSALAGHVIVEDDVIIGGLSGIHQFVRLGRGAIIGAVTMVTNDVIPYGLVQSPRGALDGLNLVGLKRGGVARSDITALRAAYQMLAQGEGAFADRARRLAEETESDYVRTITDFILSDSDRSFLTPT